MFLVRPLPIHSDGDEVLRWDEQGYEGNKKKISTGNKSPDLLRKRKRGRLTNLRKGERFMKDDFFTVNELARYFGVNPKTIYRRLWTKGIPAYWMGE